MWSAGSIGVVGFGTNHIFFRNIFNLEIAPANPNKNTSYGIPRSRGHNFLLKNVKFFEIHQKIHEIGRLEFGISTRNRRFAWFPSICLTSLYISFYNYKYKGNQQNQRFRREIRNSNQPSSAKFWPISKISTFFNRKLCPLERGMQSGHPGASYPE